MRVSALTLSQSEVVMAAPFATVQDLKDRWPDYPTGSDTLATTLLGDASVRIRTECKDVDARISDGALDSAVPKMIVCEMVKRSMIASSSQMGVTSIQETAGPLSQSLSYANPMGELYLKKQERRLLGCGSGRAFMIDTLPNPDVMR